MEIATRSKVSGVDSGSAERSGQKRKVSSPPHSSNGHSPSDTSPSPMKKKKKPGAVHSSKDQSELRHGPFYYVKQPALTTDPVDVVPQDGRNDFYCWVCHREGQVLCCELCPRVYHAKCLKLAAEPEGDWFCPECEKITVAECIETQSKAMTMLTLDQLSYLLKFALQKMKQPGDQPRTSAHSPHATASQRKAYNWTEPFQKPVSLEQHPDYAEYIFHPMDLCTLEKNIKKKMYGCTEAFLADVKWILHNCIIYNGGNHKLTATAKVIVRICEHEMNEIEVCPECYLSACQKRDNWFCEPCSNPHPLVWAKLKGFPFWPAKALRDKDGQVDARFFGQHDRAWVPINNCYLMSKEIPFSVKKTKSIFNSAMQEMEVYVENIRKKFGVFNYAPFRTPYTPDNHFQMLLDPANPAAGSVKPEKQEKIKFNFDMTASPKMHLGKSMLSASGGGGAGVVGMGGLGMGRSSARRISVTDMPRSPMSTNSSNHTGSDGEQEGAEKGQAARPPSGHYSTGEESQDCTASPAPGKSGVVMDSPKPFHSQAPSAVKQEKGPPTPSILNLNLDRSKAEMDLKELSESVQQQQQQQQQGAPPLLTSPKRQIRSRFQLNLDKTIENCKAQLGINEISEDAYKAVEDSEESDKSDSSDSEYGSDDEQKPNKDSQEPATATAVKSEKDASKKKSKALPPSSSSPAAQEQDKPKLEGSGAGEGPATTATTTATTTTTTPKTEPASKTGTDDPVPKDRQASEGEKEASERAKAAPEPPSTTRDKAKASQEPQPPALAPAMDADLDSDSDKELVIDLGDDHGERGRKRGRKDSAAASTSTSSSTSAAKEASAATKADGKAPITTSVVTPSQQHAPVCSSPGPKDLAQPSASTPASILSFPAAPLSSSTPLPGPAAAASSSSSTSSSASSATPLTTVKKQRPLLPRETVPVVQHAVVWNPTAKFQTSSQKWHMQKVQRQQQQPAAQVPTTQTQAQTPQAQTPPQRSQQVLTTSAAQQQQQQQQASSSSSSSSSSSTRYQTRQAVKAVQQKELPHGVSTSSVTLVGGSPVSVAIAAATPGASMSSSSSSSSPAVMATDLHIPTTSADVAADIAKYTSKIMDAIKGTMTELYNDLSKSTSGNTIQEIRRLRIEIEKLQWLHQQELSEMKHNLELTMAEMRQSLEQERERLVAEVRKQMEAERQQAVDETKKKQWCANCRKEAIFYCCWNTSYCDYPCQQAHWPEHMKSCTQSATASQQEPETEQCTDTPAKVCGQPGSTHNSPREGGAPTAPTPQDLGLEKSKDSVTVSVA